MFPKVNVVRGRRFVDNGKMITAGGLTSGVDAALHVVQRYYDEDVAQQVADYMEYQSQGWKVA
jgi:transcriptional regulator GlxA family with amidase domain